MADEANSIIPSTKYLLIFICNLSFIRLFFNAIRCVGFIIIIYTSSNILNDIVSEKSNLFILCQFQYKITL